MTDSVLVDRQGGVALITLNRPEARNAINQSLALAFADAVNGAQNAGCIVVTGAEPAFCAGLDLRNLGTDRLADLSSYSEALSASRVPLIAAVNGPAVTGGFEIALGCDFIIASERAAFADTHLRIGVFPGPVMIDLPRRIGMARAREMSMTGNFVDAATAFRIGLANHVVPHADLLPFALKLAADIAAYDRQMISSMREDWDSIATLPISEARAAHARFREAHGYADGRGADIAARRDVVIAPARGAGITPSG